MDDLISRQQAIDALIRVPGIGNRALDKIRELPPAQPAQPEYHEIGYRECADAVLKMWMDNVLTDGEYNRIINKLNAKWAIVEGDAE